VGIRIEQGVSQAQMANRLGVSQQAVSQFEKVTYTPTVDLIFAYAQALGVKVKFCIAAS
jgi:DNA-binding XRE family transcriptional regulator